jgi:hypothetical protein
MALLLQLCSLPGYFQRLAHLPLLLQQRKKMHKVSMPYPESAPLD